jgi:uncharacterized protein YggE
MQPREPPEASVRSAPFNTRASPIPKWRAESNREEPPMSGSRILVLAIALLSAPVLSAQTSSAAFDDRPKITVSGEAMVNVVPDRIIVSFGIETADFDVAVAKQKSNALTKKAIAALKDLRIPDKEIQTDYISIESRFQGNSRTEGFLGFWVRNTFVVTLNDAARVEDLIAKVLATNGTFAGDLDANAGKSRKEVDAAMKAARDRDALATGIVYLNGVDFQTKELRKFREQARELALKAAREKADKMAAALGEKAGRPIQISDGGSGWWHFSSWSGRFGRGGGGMSQNVVQDAGAGGGDALETIALGTIGIRANVSATFELKR